MKLNDVKSAFRKPYGYISYPLTAILLLLLLFIVVREPLMRYYIDKKIDSFSQKHNSEIKYSSLSFSGLTTVTLHDFSIGEIGKKSLVSASSIKIKVGFWKLLLRRLSIDRVEVKKCDIVAIKQDRTDNYSFLLKQKSKNNIESVKSKKLSEIVDGILGSLFDLIPATMTITQLNVSLTSNSHQLQLILPSLEILNRNFSAKIEMIELGNHSIFYTKGVLDKENEEIALKIYGDNRQSFIMPWIEKRNNALISFDTAYFKIKHDDQSNNDKQIIVGSGELTNLRVYHKRIAADTVGFKKIATEYKLNVGADYIEYDSSSTVTINNLQIHPYGYFRPKPSKRIVLSLNKPLFEASELFSSLPEGLFDNFKGIEVEGLLSYSGFLDLDMATPDSLIFNSDLMQKNFKIRKPGATDFRKVNNFSYTHHVFENEKEVKQIVLGPSNPNYIPFERIPVSIKNAILMSEDGWFFEHGGFSLGAFRQSIITNIKTKRFARGGSTVSMQLVKNLFLNRKKNIARKVEELLIVWVLERNRLVSKERMFEIYVNIIEWGPGIYGASEAARFYFNKDVSALTLDETIYLGAIIPSPKNYRFLFNEDGSFKEYILNYYELVLRKMVEHEMITQAEADASARKVILNGEAKALIEAKAEAKKKKLELELLF